MSLAELHGVFRVEVTLAGSAAIIAFTSVAAMRARSRVEGVSAGFR